MNEDVRLCGVDGTACAQWSCRRCYPTPAPTPTAPPAAPEDPAPPRPRRRPLLLQLLLLGAAPAQPDGSKPGLR